MITPLIRLAARMIMSLLVGAGIGCLLLGYPSQGAGLIVLGCLLEYTARVGA